MSDTGPLQRIGELALTVITVAATAALGIALLLVAEAARLIDGVPRRDHQPGGGLRDGGGGTLAL